MESISDIKNKLSETDDESLPLVMSLYIGDERSGVQKLLENARKRYDKLLAEKQRIYDLQAYERQYSDHRFICGIDEVGRGPFAGPVVAGAVILPKDCDILYINDSKKLTEKAAVGIVEPARIDEINILQATYEAMRIAISKLDPKPDLLLNDAVTIPGVDIKQVPIIKGDAKSISIGAASIFAKVTRDRLMMEYDARYPEYGFAKNVGYGTAEHIEALKKYGPTPIHRRSFIHDYV